MLTENIPRVSMSSQSYASPIVAEPNYTSFPVSFRANGTLAFIPGLTMNRYFSLA